MAPEPVPSGRTGRMEVLSVNLGSDPAGISSGIARAFRNDPDWHVESHLTKLNYIEYAAEPWNALAVREAWLKADVVHLHHGFITAERITRGYLGKRLPKRPYVVHHHGTGFREDPRVHLAEIERQNAIGIVSTLDLHVISGLEWLPSPIDVDQMQATRPAAWVAHRRSPMVRIAHAPTNRQIKSTALLIEAVERLQAEGHSVELDIIERVPWHECLRRKAQADIFFDQVLLGYGNNALEAWGMGIPVIAGADDETLDEMERRFDHLPFYHATEDTIYDALKELVESPELREAYGKIGYQYVRAYHSEEVVVEQLKRLYQRAIEQQESKAA